MPHPRLIAALCLLAAAAPLSAQPGPMPGPMTGGPGRAMPVRETRATAIRHESREGKVEVSVFFAEDLSPGALGKGAVAVTTALREGETMPGDATVFEAAAIDRLAAAGYQTAVPQGGAGQAVSLHVTRMVIEPQEAPHKPVSGEMTMGVSNHGSMMGMALAVDLTKPRPALVSTRLEARLVDAASGKVLWEGRADIATREGDPQWGSAQIAGKLAGALFATLKQPTDDRTAVF